MSFYREPMEEQKNKLIWQAKITGAIMAIAGLIPFCWFFWGIIDEMWAHKPLGFFILLLFICAWVGIGFGGLLGKQIIRGRGVLAGAGLGLACGLIVGLLTGFIIFTFIGALIGSIVGLALGAILGAFAAVPFAHKWQTMQRKK